MIEKEMNSTELTIKPVRGTVIASLLSKMSSSDGTPTTVTLETGKASIKLMEYCVGFGVVDTPPDSPDDDLLELYELFEADTVRKKRVVWVSHILCDNNSELQLLVERILEVS